MITRKFLLAATAGLLLAQAPAHAADATAYVLPLSLAVEAATEAVRACEASGFRVSVSVVDLSGQSTAQVRGDNSTPHTPDTAFRKAYTVVTFGRNYNLDTSAQVAAAMSKNAALYSAILTIPNVAPLPGAVGIKAGGHLVAAIGVSGAPGGDKDEACALAGIAKVASRLPG